jgi:hypothetical protein
MCETIGLPVVSALEPVQQLPIGPITVLVLEIEDTP